MLSLALLRHAKSSWDASDIEDFDRPLNERGRLAAPLMGNALAAFKFKPGLILCSSAKRTRETFDLIAPLIDTSKAEIVFEDQLYLTSEQTLYNRLKAVSATTKSVLLIGHNPGLHALALMLTGTGDAKSITRIEDKYPTGALALFTFPQTTWRDLLPAAGHLEAFVTPRDRA